MNKRVFFVGGTSSKTFDYLRATLPLLHLSSAAQQVGIILDGGNFFKLAPDEPPGEVVVFSNVVAPQYIHIIEKWAKHADIILQLDDDYWHIAGDNPTQDQISQLELDGLSYCLGLARQIWVTTEHLRQQLGHQDKTLVVPNLVDMRHYPEYTAKTSGRVLWAGGGTHYEDLRLIGNLPATMTDRQFIFFGQLPPQCAFPWVRHGRAEVISQPVGINVGFVRGVPFDQYQSHLRQLAQDSGVGICPLVDSLFNRSKSALKYCELAAMGLPVVASGFESSPYSVIVDGVNGYLANSEDEWRQKIEMANNEIGRAGYEWVRENLSWQSSAGVQAWFDAIMAACREKTAEIVWGHIVLSGSNPG